MSPNRTVGWVLLMTAFIGILLSITGLVLLWTTAGSVSNLLMGMLDLSHRSLVTSQEGLVVISGSLTNAHNTAQVIESSANGIADSIDQTIPMVNSAGLLVGVNMAGAVRNTQAALTSAQASAKVVDDTLNFISSLPLIGSRYKPVMPLSSSISEVNNSLTGLPDSLDKLQASLNTSSKNLKTIQGKVNDLAQNARQFDANITQAQGVITKYQTQVGEMDAFVVRLEGRLPFWMMVYRVAGTLFLLWLGFSQVGLILQAVDQARGDQATEYVRATRINGKSRELDSTLPSDKME